MSGSNLTSATNFNTQSRDIENLVNSDSFYTNQKRNVNLKYSKSERKPNFSKTFQLKKLFCYNDNNFEKRKSASLDNVVLQMELYGKIALNKNGVSQQKSVSNCEISKSNKKHIDYNKVLLELRTKHRSISEPSEYASLEKLNENKGQTCVNQIQPFPIENNVEVRHNSDAVRRTTYRSQTLHEYAFRNQQQQLEEVYIDTQIDIKGVVKVCYEGTTRKLNKNQFLRICNDRINLITDKGDEETIIDRINETHYKPVSKKELVITRDAENLCKIYKLQFDSTKDLNIAVIDFEQYYGGNRPYCVNKLQINGEEKLQIRHKLLKLLGKRSSKDLLEKKGIIKNEPIFGNTLKHLYDTYKHEVPEFVVRIIQIIELPKNISSIGLYRASGNLATIQKIRFHIDKNNLKILDEFKNDIDVLTGSLKLFFRELKEPLIPHKMYEELCKYIDTGTSSKSEDIIKQLISKMEKPHRKTLLTLLEHLTKVESYHEENRMDTYNISIVWGPTLIWPPDNCHENILLSHTNANKVIELLLNVYKQTLEVLHKTESSPKISYKKQTSEDAAKTKSALILELNENLTHNLRKSHSKDNIIKSNDSISKASKSPDKEVKFDLEQLCASSKEKVPEFVLKVIPLIEKGINFEFLYKKNGSNEKLDKIKKKITKNRSNLSSMEKYNVYDLASALKMFFLELKTPIIPKDVLDRLVLATDERIEMTKLRLVKKELSNSTIPHRETLDYLLKHLVNVSHHEEQNKMFKHSLAMEWGPILCRSFIDNHEISSGACVQVIETLLQIYDNKSVPNVEFTEDDHCSNPNQVLPPVFKRLPKITKNDSSLYRVSKYINTVSMYDNVQYEEDIKNEATILETHCFKSSRKNPEDKTKS